MAFALPIALLLLAGYVLGSIPFGLLTARSRGIDIREHGSRNIGATNVWRVLGWKVGLTTFLCDTGKGFLAVLLARWAGPHWGVEASTAGIAAACGCLLGHNFPVWLRFKGGKGVATSIGVLFAMMPLAALLTFLTWGIVFKLTRYVSLASILGGLGLPMYVQILTMLGWMEGRSNFYFAAAAGLLVTVRHVPNIKRLLAGTENRFGKGAPAASEIPPPP